LVFVHTKKSRNHTYLQIVENYREDGKVRQRVVQYLGNYDSPEEALEGMSHRLRRARTMANRMERTATNVSGRAHEDPKARALIDQAATARQRADDLAAKVTRLKTLLEGHPSLRTRGDQDKDVDSVVTNT
jgi:hypothetical protein